MQAVISRVHKIVATPESAAPQQASTQCTTSLPFGEEEQVQLLVYGDNEESEPAPRNVAPTHCEPQPSLAPENEQIVIQLQFATLLTERKSAVTSLQQLLHEYQNQNQYQSDLVQLGQRVLPILLYALTSDPRDTDLMETILEVIPQFIHLKPALASIILQPLYRAPESSTTSFSDRLIAAAAAASGDSTPSQPSSWAASHPTTPSGIALLLELLQDSSSWIRGPALNILKLVQEHQSEAFLAVLLDCQEGLRKLLEMTQETREDIRYLVLQLLVKLTDGASFVQQFIAFEDGFHRFFSIITSELGTFDETEDENRSISSPVVSDCLEIIRNVIRENTLTQKLLFQTRYLETILPELLCPKRMDTMENSPRAKMHQKRSQLLSLQTLRFLVSDVYEGIPLSKLDEMQSREREKKHQLRTSIQQAIGTSSRLMAAIGEVAIDKNWAEDERMGMENQLQAIDLLGQITGQNESLQLGIVHLYTFRSKKSVLAGIVSLELEEEDAVSAAATGFLDTLCENMDVRLGILQHIYTIPPSVEPMETFDAEGPGRMLLEGIMLACRRNVQVLSLEKDTIVAWKAIHRFLALILGHYDCKRVALRITIEESASSIRLFSQCLRIISSESALTNFRLHFAMLKLLVLWSIECPDAVHEILCSVSNVSMLVENVARRWNLPEQLRLQLQSLSACLLGCCLEYTDGAAVSRKELLTLLTHRIGLEAFTDCLKAIKSYFHASRSFGPGSSGWEALEQWEASGQESVLLVCAQMDNVSANRIGGLVDKVVGRMLRVFLDPCEDEVSNENHVVQPYRELIGMQDKEICQLKARILELERRNAHRRDDTNDVCEQMNQTHRMILEDLTSALWNRTTFMQPYKHIAHPVELNQESESNKEKENDLAIMVASLSIQCKTFAENLEGAKGLEAVQNALEVSIERGADANTFHVLDDAYT
uniref:Uncharacterized protein AlNc14C52G4055 n=1 Tax=Albugo laibachii Nc14 TaxID=890382 RepID=F0WBL0_9STRA|nr:conserved hypothetical protein [Albugo laibachii Nc14]|eukprot:CCA18537.1 conserved hypothetical protein [Albugo laibachii Nc14]